MISCLVFGSCLKVSFGSLVREGYLEEIFGPEYEGTWMKGYEDSPWWWSYFIDKYNSSNLDPTLIHTYPHEYFKKLWTNRPPPLLNTPLD